MDFFLSKLIPLFVYPAGLASLLIIAALLFWKKQKFARLLIWLALAVIFLCGNRWLSMSLVRSLEQQYLPQTEYAPADVAILWAAVPILSSIPDQWLRLMAPVIGSSTESSCIKMAWSII